MPTPMAKVPEGRRKVPVTVTLDPEVVDMLFQGIARETSRSQCRVTMSSLLNQHLKATLPKLLEQLSETPRPARKS